MKIAPSKVLLVVGLGIYGYCLRGQFSEPQKLEGAAASTNKELTAELVNHGVGLNVMRDPFTGTLIKGTGERKQAAVVKAPVKPLGPMILQGVAVSEELRSAIVNGKTLREGEAQSLEEGGPEVCAKTIGMDYVVMRAGNRDVLLHLEKPKTQKEGEDAVAASGAPAVAKPLESAASSADTRGRPRYVSQENKK
jgi:hypothetical protein